MEKNDTDDTDIVDYEAKRVEETHCVKCGAYLGSYGRGSFGISTCPKCKESYEMDYTGEQFVMKRGSRKRK